MFGRLRRQSWFAALLLALSPALAGAALPLLHPCPVDTPWMATAAGHAHEAMAGMAAHHGALPAPHAVHECSCIDCGAVPPLVAPPAPVVVAARIVRPRTVAWPVVEGRATSRPFLEHLPESTAPPLG